MTAAAGSMPSSTTPFLLKFGQSQQSVLPAEIRQPANQDAFSSMPLISTVIALPSLPSGGARVRAFPEDNPRGKSLPMKAISF